MSWSCSIRFVMESGAPLGNHTVAIFFSGLMGGYVKDATDEDGWVQFEEENRDGPQSVEAIYFTFLLASITVDEDITIDDGDTLSYTIPDEEF